MAKTIPVAVTHHGQSGGRQKANSTAVTSALLSARNGARGLPVRRRQAASVNTAATAATAMLSRIPGP